MQLPLYHLHSQRAEQLIIKVCLLRGDKGMHLHLLLTLLNQMPLRSMDTGWSTRESTADCRPQQELI